MRAQNVIKLLVICIAFSWSCGATVKADLFGDITKKLSEAGDAIVETGGKVVDGVKEAGQDIGVIEKDEPAQKPEAVKKEVVETPVAEPAGTAVASASSEPLPGGVTSRINKMYKELDKVEKKLSTGAGSASDRAKRAKLDLDRAQKFMDEIEKRYSGQYSPDHPDMIAAVSRLQEARTNFDLAMSDATAKDSAIAAANAKARAEEAAERERLAKQAREKAAADRAAMENAQAVCENWRDRLAEYAFGDKAFSSYKTNDEQELATWRTHAGEAKSLLAEYPKGLCPSEDNVAELLADKIAQFEEVDMAIAAEKKAMAADIGEILFATTPFTGTNNPAVQKTFRAGDYIYGIIKVVKPWSVIYKNDQSANIRVDVTIDGKKIHAQFVNLKDPDYVKRDYLIFNIAPDVKNMVAYSDPKIEYGKTTAAIIQGPNELTHHLSQLTPGSHTVSFDISYYGKSWATGEFTVEGDDFGAYAALHSKIAGGVVAARTLPAAQMQNKGMEQEMAELLKEAGWDNVYRLNIVDKDWWIERVDGGDTPVKARYLAAVALTKKSDGSYCYKKCTFHQDKLITGAFGQLYLSHQGDEVAIAKDNIDK